MRKRVDDQRYTIRFTPRRSRSIWSTVNIQRIEELQRLGLMRPAGLEAFARRAEERSNVYAYEQQERATLDESDERQFRANDAAWTFFQAQPNWYRKAAVWWVVSAKKDDTRRKRQTTLIEDSAGGRTVRPLTRPGRHESEAGAGL